MKFASHAKAGFVISAIAATLETVFRDFKTGVLAGILCFVGAVIPDLDTDSIPSRWAARFGAAFMFICVYMAHEHPGAAVEYYFPAAVAGLLFFTIKAFPHRSFTHSWFGPVICFALGVYHGNFLYSAFGVGLMCHLIVDRLGPLDSRNWL